MATDYPSPFVDTKAQPWKELFPAGDRGVLTVALYGNNVPASVVERGWMQEVAEQTTEESMIATSGLGGWHSTIGGMIATSGFGGSHSTLGSMIATSGVSHSTL